ncbi:Fur family transcriptional regulator [Legionella jordanis]|uniref:Transcriptional regulator np20, Fur family n=1 Tax=Legionella jordanis TaxID=456 RepID=A0A0W0V9R2_9GAMM|nr:transcriptional repressor [Legionella jordanis]KTD16875.1 transcriptional regulator np20, Fur family [Legionella jordanis]VEH13571.1 transcriptional regulator np20, Fur family [Legionella jordanis]
MNLKLTSLRKTVLFVLWDNRKPLKAYEILNKLLPIHSNSTAPSIYRVLDYFVDYGVVHKIESIQAYTLCHEPGKKLPSEILMVCNQCHQVQEIYDINLQSGLETLAQSNCFHLGQDVIELKGICGKCQA